MKRCVIYFCLLCLIPAISANVWCQDGEPADGDAPAGYDFAYDDGEPLPQATFRVNVVDFVRPEWEQELSMGSVDVIIPDDFKGEQKKLPDYLDMVPGLHVERRGGDGQYSTVTMRGSTSAQVTIASQALISKKNFQAT